MKKIKRAATGAAIIMAALSLAACSPAEKKGDDPVVNEQQDPSEAATASEENISVGATRAEELPEDITTMEFDPTENIEPAVYGPPPTR